MNFNELIKLCEPCEVTGPQPVDPGMLTQDSRTVSEGSVFIAVRGLQTDGHVFIDDAVENGATVIVCEDASVAPEGVTVIEVESTRNLVGPLAQAFQGYPAARMKLIGITGTNGKTTVATLAYQSLQKLGARPSLLGTVAKRIGNEESDSLLTTSDPVELASDMRRMVDVGSTHLVMEVSSHALDQLRVNGLNFQVAAFTNLSHDHLDYHSTLTEYANTKKKLFDGLQPEAWAVINADDDQAELMTKNCSARIVDFSFRESATVSCRIISITPDGLKVSVDGIEITSPMVGKFNAYNVAQTFLICHSLGFDEVEIADALSRSTGATGRLERIQSDQQRNQPLVLVDYAHTPDALDNVLSSLADLKGEKQKLHVVFGCGGNRDKSKRPIMAAIAQQHADIVTVTSDNPRNENPETIIDDIMSGFSTMEAVNRIADRKVAIHHAVGGSDANTIVLIAGKGHEHYQEINGERHDFDDRKIALEALDNLNKTDEVS